MIEITIPTVIITYITYDKFRCEIISVKRCPTENLLHRNFSMTWFQWKLGELLKYHRIYTTENIITEIYGTEINGNDTITN